MLLVDDCSEDISWLICQKFANIDKKIKTYRNKINKSTAQTRKEGIINATGEYIIFVDNDDWIEPEMLNELYMKTIKDNYDMVFCDFIMEMNISHKKLIIQINIRLWNKLCHRVIFTP